MKYRAHDIENIIYPFLPKEEGHQARVIEAMNYAFKAGGKRIRPMLMKLCYDLYADENDISVVAPFMAAIEMIHTYSLIHDDLPALDNDELRRGRPTVHVRYGEDIAILAGDGLLNYAYETASKAFLLAPAKPSIERAFICLATKPGIYGMIGGQTLDVLKSGEKIEEEELDFIYRNKTSALIECAMMIGAILGGASDEDVKKIENIASAVGLAFQVQDDILDIIGDEGTLGKPINSDEKNNKYTYATIHGIEKSHEFVENKTRETISNIDSLYVKNYNAKDDLKGLLETLINRDK